MPNSMQLPGGLAALHLGSNAQMLVRRENDNDPIQYLRFRLHHLDI